MTNKTLCMIVPLLLAALILAEKPVIHNTPQEPDFKDGEKNEAAYAQQHPTPTIPSHTSSPPKNIINGRKVTKVRLMMGADQFDTYPIHKDLAFTYFMNRPATEMLFMGDKPKFVWLDANFDEIEEEDVSHMTLDQMLDRLAEMGFNWR